MTVPCRRHPCRRRARRYRILTLLEGKVDGGRNDLVGLVGDRVDGGRNDLVGLLEGKVDGGRNDLVGLVGEKLDGGRNDLVGLVEAERLALREELRTDLEGQVEAAELQDFLNAFDGQTASWTAYIVQKLDEEKALVHVLIPGGEDEID
jgi:hypothetical protein